MKLQLQPSSYWLPQQLYFDALFFHTLSTSLLPSTEIQTINQDNNMIVIITQKMVMKKQREAIIEIIVFIFVNFILSIQKTAAILTCSSPTTVDTNIHIVLLITLIIPTNAFIVICKCHIIGSTEKHQQFFSRPAFMYYFLRSPHAHQISFKQGIEYIIDDYQKHH